MLVLGRRGDVTGSWDGMRFSVMDGPPVAGRRLGWGASYIVTRIVTRISRSGLVKLMVGYRREEGSRKLPAHQRTSWGPPI